MAEENKLQQMEQALAAEKQASAEMQRREDELRKEMQRRDDEARKELQRKDDEILKQKQRGDAFLKELRGTSLREYLDLCHEHYTKSITIQTNKYKTTQGDVKNATGKKHPIEIKPWTNFVCTQKETWNSLFSQYTKGIDVFSSPQFLKESGEQIAKNLLASELDLHSLQRTTVESPVSAILNHLREHGDCEPIFGLAQLIRFENHMTSLNSDTEEVRQKPEEQQPFVSTPRPKSKPPSATSKTARAQPDQICVVTEIGGKSKVLVAIEYKPPHKLELDALRHVLGHQNGPQNEITVAKIVNMIEVPTDEMESFEFRATESVTAVITQIFSYMVRCGTQYGYFTTGEAFVFLYIKPEEKLQTVYYHLAIPIDDAKGCSDDNDHLLRTAVGQVLMFNLQALRSPEMSISDRNQFYEDLPRWEVDDNEILRNLAESPRAKEERSPSAPQRYSRLANNRSSPIQTRSRTTCDPGFNPASEDDQNPSSSNDDESASPDMRIRSQAVMRDKQAQSTYSSTDVGSSSSGGQRRAFCTQACLHGLLRGGALDRCCPNVSEHCEKGDHGDRHQLDGEEFRMLLSDQLRRRRGDACDSLGLQGARGALFRITLTSHGYTIAAKGTVSAYAKDLRHEAEVYRRLTTIQGIHVPICLGSLDLEKPFYYDAGIRIVHLMLLSWSGECLDGKKTIKDTDRQFWVSDLLRAVKAIHRAGVLHRDIRMPNLLWNEGTQRVMVIDFERAEIAKTVLALSPGTPTRRRKRVWKTKQVDCERTRMEMKREEWEARIMFASPSF